MTQDHLRHSPLNARSDLHLLFERLGLGQVREMAQTGGLDILIVRELDRLSRNLAKQFVVEEEMKRHGVEVDYVLADYPDTPEARLNKHIRATIAKYEREKINERMIKGRRQKVQAGNVLVFGHPPYGYRVANREGKTTLAVCESEACVVRLIYTWCHFSDGVRLQFRNTCAIDQHANTGLVLSARLRLE